MKLNTLLDFPECILSKLLLCIDSTLYSTLYCKLELTAVDEVVWSIEVVWRMLPKLKLAMLKLSTLKP